MAQTTVAGGFIDADLVSAQTALTSGLVSTDELIISDAGVLKRMDVSVLEDYIVTNLGDNNIDVAQSSHGFAVGDVIRVTSGSNNTYEKARANTAVNAEVIGIVIDVTDTNNFTYATSGEITVAAAVPNSTTAGQIVYLNTDTAGETQTTEPSATDQISKPIAIITEANNKMVLIPFRGEIISGGATSFAPVDATYLTLGTNGTLSGERVFTAGTGLTLADAGAGGAATLTVDNDSITFSKMQNVAANSVLVRNANSSGDLAELALATTQILIGNGTGFTAAALSGEATMTNAGVVSIADNIIDEANLKVSNAPTDGHVLTARSGNTGGFTWEAASAGATLSGSTDNTIVTVTGANAMIGETNLTYTGNYLYLQGAASDTTSSGIHWGTSSDTTLGTLEYDTTNGRFQLMVNNTASVLRIDNTTLFLDKGQIKFPATANLSSDAHTLDDYEEGTFTPVFQDWSYSNSEGQTYTQQVGRYVKIGRWVTIQIYIASDLSSSSLSDGSQSKLDGLPFTATAGTGFNYAICCSYSYGATLSNTGSASQNITGMVNANTAYVILHKWSTYLGVQPLNYSHIDDRAFSMVFTGQYETNA